MNNDNEKFDKIGFIHRLEQLIQSPDYKKNVSKFARDCGIKEQTVRKWREGSMPGIGMLAMIVRGTGVNMYWLVTGDGPMWGPASTPEPPPHEVLDRARLTAAIEDSLAVLDAVDAEMAPPHLARMICLMYDLLSDQTEPQERGRVVLELVKSMKSSAGRS